MWITKTPKGPWYKALSSFVWAYTTVYYQKKTSMRIVEEQAKQDLEEQAKEDSNLEEQAENYSNSRIYKLALLQVPGELVPIMDAYLHGYCGEPLRMPKVLSAMARLASRFFIDYVESIKQAHKIGRWQRERDDLKQENIVSRVA